MKKFKKIIIKIINKIDNSIIQLYPNLTKHMNNEK